MTGAGLSVRTAVAGWRSMVGEPTMEGAAGGLAQGAKPVTGTGAPRRLPRRYAFFPMAISRD